MKDQLKKYLPVIANTAAAPVVAAVLSWLLLALVNAATPTNTLIGAAILVYAYYQERSHGQ